MLQELEEYMNEVKTPKKPLISYYLIVLICLFLFNALAMPWLAERRIKEVDYGTFPQLCVVLGTADPDLYRHRTVYVQEADEPGRRKECHGIRHGKEQCQDVCEIFRGDPVFGCGRRS